MKYLIDRLKERSTWMGIIAVLSGFGIAIEPELIESISATGVAVAGLIAAVTKD